MPEKTQRRRAGGSSRSRSGGAQGSSSSRGSKSPQKTRTDISPLTPVLDPPDIESFTEFDLGDEIQAAILAMGITKPTPIQALTIEPVLKGKDIIAKAETGTGKTLAFGAPMMAKIDPSRATVLGLVLSPTRELAEQVHDVLEKLGEARGVKTALVVGGEDMGAQIRKIQAGAQVIVGTPGRVLDLLNQKFLQFPWTEFAILDEADKMLEIGFIDDVKKILDACNEYRNTLLFSATFPPPLLELARGYTSDPMEVATASGVATVDNINQYVLRCSEEDRPRGLSYLIEDSAPSDVFLVFCERRTDVDQLMRKLERQRFSVKALHGGYDQAARFRVMAAFRTGEVKCLIATDVASRGLDVVHVTHVVNLGVPRDVSDYTHRIGRTGRAGRHGVALTFVSRKDERGFTELEERSGFNITELESPREVFTIERNRARDVDSGEGPIAKDSVAKDTVLEVEAEVNDASDDREERRPRRRGAKRASREPVANDRANVETPDAGTGDRGSEERPRRRRRAETQANERTTETEEERPRRPRRTRASAAAETPDREESTEERPRRSRRSSESPDRAEAPAPSSAPEERSTRRESAREERPERKRRPLRASETRASETRASGTRASGTRASGIGDPEGGGVSEAERENRARAERDSGRKARTPRAAEPESSERSGTAAEDTSPRRRRTEGDEDRPSTARRRRSRGRDRESSADESSEARRESSAEGAAEPKARAPRRRTRTEEAPVDQVPSGRARGERAPRDGAPRDGASRERTPRDRDPEVRDEPKAERPRRSRASSSTPEEESRGKPEAKRPKRARAAENASRDTRPSRPSGFGQGV